MGVAVFFALAAGGLIASELGVFSGSMVTTSATPPSPATSLSPSVPGNLPLGPHGSNFPPGPGSSYLSGTRQTPVTATKLTGINEAQPGSTSPDPAGPNPYSIPNGRKLLAQRSGPTIGNLPLQDRLPRIDLYQLSPPSPTLSPANLYGNGQDAQALASNYRLSGIVNGADGNINGILEIGGQSQTVKPGDTLSDGSTVESISGTGLTLRTPGGTLITVSLSTGSDSLSNGQGYPGQVGVGNGGADFGGNG